MKRAVYHPLAGSELIESSLFYERRRRFLGEEFIIAVEDTIRKISANPQHGRMEKPDSRSYKVERFPFRVVYREQADRIWIVAVAHLSRRPGYWRRRLA